ncbi:glycolate oxidase subunit GlcE [Cupriavidus sp. USMAA2-4]|uniref:Glycolate oxidase subunit GlcE n=1 Tax=Cupriavidus malaysiensis TaxID=367825 RepID=A0ABM6F7D2_9BURK|nr:MULTISPECIES: glycolate oxidase subunit GlcE [Cupriavidus]AOY92798.1 glycolate oxidase subunit GlcE [Cupriavidus sp. USMAA2-4]AOZ00733.1 glycolate oxidase subunit GlcE [Cupriavidus sp. USMAHM13]AOZ07490.1 glycolate oxidase subunit GlcE [Cupriavidus malaysiensis]
MDTSLDAFRDAIRQAAAQRTPLRLRGGGSKDFYGQAPAGTLLDTRGWRGIVEYDPAELVVTARCGTPLAELEAALAEKRQMLAFEPPHLDAGAGLATVGGAVAAGLSGPRRQSVGALRDFVLGAQLMDGRGEVLNFGGQVMKNVAGYDVSRLLAGSLGTLGLILEVSLKVLPIPFADTTLRFAFDQQQALDALNTWGGRPLPIAASAWHDGALHVRLSGAEAALRAACAQLGGETVAESESAALWQALREQSHAFFAPVAAGRALWRIAVPGTAAPLALPGAQLVEWGGGQRWWLADDDSADTAAHVRAAAQAARGHATLFRNGDKSVGVFTPQPAPLAAIHARLKAAFDPAGIFNPQRLYPGL